MKFSAARQLCLGILIAFLAAACSNAAAFVGATPTSQPASPEASTLAPAVPPHNTAPARQDANADLKPTNTSTPEATSTPTISAAAIALATKSARPTECPPDLCSYHDPFPLARPIAPPGQVTVDVSYRFGSTQNGKRDPHHGVEFLNSVGTRVLAAADGVVVVAGDDRKTLYGPYYNFYGNLIILEHQLPNLSQPLYTLYAHLSELLVEEGQRVQVGEEIGRVGMSGVATGSHLHFEVRLDENSYRMARNPELWLKPLRDVDDTLQGALAGRIIAPPGINLKIPNIVIERLSGPDSEVLSRVYLGTYEERALKGLSPWEESFAVSDLSPGWYRVSLVQYGIQQKEFPILPGELTVVTFDFSDKN